MRNRPVFALVAVIVMVAAVGAAGDRMIGPENHTGDLRFGAESVQIVDGTEVWGNIFIEEGDLFIGSEVDIVGSITIKKGNIFIKDNVDISKMIAVDHGNIVIGGHCTLAEDVKCRFGNVKMGPDSVVKGDVIAKDLTRGTNADIQGKFIKVEH